MAQVNLADAVTALSVTVSALKKELDSLSGKMGRIEALLVKTSSKVRQMSSRGYAGQGQSRRGGYQPGGGGYRGRNRSRSEERKSGPSQASSRSRSKKARTKTPLSKLPKDLLTVNERDEYKNEIKEIRKKSKVPKEKWDEYNSEEKAFHNLLLKKEIDVVVARRNDKILREAEKKIRPSGL